MLHVWLLPLLAVLFLVLVGFYLVLKSIGGTGVRTDGRVLVHQDLEDRDLPPE